MSRFRTVDISGFGKEGDPMGLGYEACCQLMLRRGVAWLKDHPGFKFEYQQYEGVTGICSAQSDAARELDSFIAKGTGCSGAQHQAVIFHLSRIQMLTYDGWLEDAGRQGCHLYETDDAEIGRLIAGASIECMRQTAEGTDPISQLLREHPERVIEVDFNDPESIEEVRKKLGGIIKGIDAEKGNEK